MGYDDFECFECYNDGCGNNPCSDDGGRCDTCLKCIHEICGKGTTNRATGALRNWDWDSNGTCERCHEDGITISILLCNYHIRNLPGDPYTKYDCNLCDYEGRCHYKLNEMDSIDQEPYCGYCCDELRLKVYERTQGTPERWCGFGYNGICTRCNMNTGVEGLTLCIFHQELIK